MTTGDLENLEKVRDLVVSLCGSDTSVHRCPSLEELHSERERERQVLGLLVPVSCTSCLASTSGLSTQSSGWGPYSLEGMGNLISRWASRLDAFSAYPDRT